MPATKSTESTPLDAGIGDRVGMAFSGTVVTRGSADGVVTATGANTEIGHIQTLITQVQPLATPSTRQLNTPSPRNAVVILITAPVLTGVGLPLPHHGPPAPPDPAPPSPP